MTRPLSFRTVTEAGLPEETEKNSLDRELDLIRARREGDKRFFRGAFEDYTLLTGLIIGAVFFGGVFVMSSGWVASDSIVVDKTLSTTPLDPGGECVDKRGEVWFNVFYDVDGHVIKVISHNVDPEIQTVIGIAIVISESESITLLQGGFGDQELEYDPDDLENGHYNASASIWQVTTDSNLDEMTQEDLQSLVDSSGVILLSKEFEIENSAHVEIIDEDPRSCWTIQGLGNWGWIMMGAEWVGGREAAMLTGGSAGIPAWWMAMVSLGMSLFFLCVQYPLMHKMYHRDTDDILNDEQLSRLIIRTLRQSTEKLHIDIDLDRLKMQLRTISIDVLVPYTTRSTTIEQPSDIRAELTKGLLEEFAVFGEMKPLQMKIVCVDEGIHESHEGNRRSLALGEMPVLTEDYSEFFANMSTYGWLEVAANNSLNRWFKKHDLVDYGTAVLSDEDAVFVRVIYKPVTRFTYFLFKPTYQDIQEDLHAHLSNDLQKYLDGKALIVSARNEKATLSDRAMAGRVEDPTLGAYGIARKGSLSDGVIGGLIPSSVVPDDGKEELVGEALVAKQGGITGALLQNPFMGDILSGVEYIANKNQQRIEKYGFWFLIVFVWIPFMASGVLVGAMLGLVARMRFQRVLAACLMGGTAASLTWAYTAKGIIEFMERYHAEAFIPFVILLAIGFTLLHLGRNKKKRREELFRESMAFFAGSSDSM